MTQVFNSILPTFQAGEKGDHYWNDWEDTADAFPRWDVASSNCEADWNFKEHDPQMGPSAQAR